MPALKKRRRIGRYISIPFVVAIVLVTVAQLLALQRSELIAELSDQVARRDSVDAATAVRQLAAMPRPPVAILVAAASSSDREVAQEAQHALSKLLRRLQRQMEDQRFSSSTARQLSAFAKALDEQKAEFAAADHSWLAKTATKVLQLANQFPASKSPTVAIHCDAVLTAITPPDSSPEISNTDSTGDLANAERDTPVDHLFEPGQAALRQESPATTSVEAAGASESATSDTSAAADIRPIGPASEPNSTWKSGWMQPVFRMMPAVPRSALPREEPPSQKSLSTPPSNDPGIDTEFDGRPLAETDSRSLLEKWRRRDGADIHFVEQELARRGFGRLSATMVEKLFSRDKHARLRLVDEVLTESVDSRPWLILLAEDEAADVRLHALTIMATSNDAELIERAWHVAIHDRDPRIGALVDRLRERREAALRR